MSVETIRMVLGRLQDDLLRFLGDRLAPAISNIALRATAGRLTEAWDNLTTDLPDLAAR